MAEAAKTLSEEYLLKKEEKVDAVTTPTEESEVKTPPISESVEVETPKIEESPVVSDETDSSTTTIAEESTETTPNENESVTEEANVSAEPEESEEVEEESEIKLATAPADFRFPTTNQSRHCFTRYIEYHRCVAAKGDDAAECDKFAKYYRSLCPGEWVDKWNEQRENGTFPGPL